MAVKKYAEVNKKICVACGVCMKSCPKAAIKIFRGCFAAVDRNLCVGCGICGKICPAGCITIEKEEE